MRFAGRLPQFAVLVPEDTRLSSLMLAVVQLARLDLNRQMILARRQRAGGIRGESAGGIVGLVEIEDDLSLMRRRGVQKAAGGISSLAARQVAKDEEQTAIVVGSRIQAIF